MIKCFSISVIAFLVVGLGVDPAPASAAPGDTVRQTYTAGGTFLVPVGVSTMDVLAVGSGGSGGSGDTFRRNSGGGGGGGQVVFRTLTVTPGESISITVGLSRDSVVSGSFGSVTAVEARNGSSSGSWGGSGGFGYTGETYVAGSRGSESSSFAPGGDGGGEAVAHSISGGEVLYGGGGTGGRSSVVGSDGAGQFGNGGAGGAGLAGGTAGAAGGQGVVILRWVEPQNGTAVTSFSFGTPPSTGAINAGSSTVILNVPGGTNLTSLVATFSLSTGAILKQGPTSQTSGTSSADYSSVVTMTVFAQNGDSRAWTVAVRYIQTVSWVPSNTSVAVAAGMLIPDAGATTSGNGAITYSVDSAGTTGCSVNSSTGLLTFTSAGTCSITAAAAETTTYETGSTKTSFVITAPEPASVGGGGGGATSDEQTVSTATEQTTTTVQPSPTIPTTPMTPSVVACQSNNPATPVFETQGFVLVSADEANKTTPRTVKRKSSPTIERAPVVSVKAGDSISLVTHGLTPTTLYLIKARIGGKYFDLCGAETDVSGLAQLPVFQVTKTGTTRVAIVNPATGETTYLKLKVPKNRKWPSNKASVFRAI